MDQNSGLKAPKKLACLLVKKCGNNGQELGNFKLITLYVFSLKICVLLYKYYVSTLLLQLDTSYIL